MFVEVLRRYLRQHDTAGSSWLGGLRHPLVGRAIGLLHADVARRWTLAELAPGLPPAARASPGPS